MFEVPVNFVIPDRFLWPEFRDGTLLSMSDELRAQRAVRNIDISITLPYQYFKRSGNEISYSSEPVVGKINVASGIDLTFRDRGVLPFVVCQRSDGFWPAIANFVTEHNSLRAGAPDTAFLVNPIQPGLKPRNAGRKGIKVLAYKGDAKNLDTRFRSPEFLARLSKLGIELRIDDHSRRKYGQIHQMHDFSEVDAVIAARNMSSEDAKTKPANKLVNAWRAGIPALLGPEPAFSELRRSELDYFEIKSADDAILVLERLQADEDFYDRVAENSKKRAAYYTEDSTYAEWYSLFNGRIRQKFEEWQRRSWTFKSSWLIRRYLMQKYSKKQARRNRKVGVGILGEP